jgi:hypothetical protein
VATVAHFHVRVERQRRLVDLQRGELVLEHLDDLCSR